MSELTSLQNPRVKQVVRLREKRQREREGLMLVEGAYELELALASGLVPQELFYCPEFSTAAPHAFDRLSKTIVSRPVFEKLSYRDHPDGVLAVMPTPRWSLEALPLSPQPFLLLAESVEKPGNLGAILRTADAAGVDALLVCDPRTDLYNPNVVRASRGTLFTLPAVECDSATCLSWLRARQIKILAATPQASDLYTGADLCQPVCLAVGTEDEGLTEFWLENADLKVGIPMAGQVNSLNVSTSTAVLLYEVVRQRQAQAGK